MGTTCTLHPMAGEGEGGPIESWAILDTCSKGFAHLMLELTEGPGLSDQGARPSLPLESATGDQVQVQLVSVGEIMAQVLSRETAWPEEVRCALAYLSQLPPERKVGVQYN